MHFTSITTLVRHSARCPPSTATLPHTQPWHFQHVVPQSSLQGSTTILKRIIGNSWENEEQFNSLSILSLPRTSCNGRFYDNSSSLVSVCTGAKGTLDSSLGFPCCRSLPFSLNEVHAGVVPCSQSGSKVRGCHFHLLKALWSSDRMWSSFHAV